MSETGGKGALSKEIYAWISEKKAKSLISGAGISRSPGSVTVEFTIEKSHSRVSVASMIAPSPDWFIAVRDVELFEKNKWITEKSLQVGVYDAGTDAGTTFTSPNQTENKTIQKITTPLFSSVLPNNVIKPMTQATVCLKNNPFKKHMPQNIYFWECQNQFHPLPAGNLS